MTLKTLMSAESEKVYIIPPGINTVTKCPVIHVVQTLFQKLDTMIEQLLRQKKKIYLIVENKDYNKVCENCQCGYICCNTAELFSRYYFIIHMLLRE